MPNNILRPSGGERVWIVNTELDPALVKIVDVDVTGGVPISIADSSSIDPFGRLRVSEPYTIFDSKQLYDKAPLIFDEDITDNSGGATSTHSTADARVRMEVGATDIIIRQTFERYNYQPGKGQLAFLTFNLLGGDASVDKKIGLFDGTDGLYLKLSGTTLSMNTIKGGTEVSVLQANWNIDKFDGTGPSGVTLDTTKVQILVIDYEWLGVGRVRMGFVYNGVVYYAHEFYHANFIGTVYTSTPNYPVRYEIDATAGGTGALDHICATIISEGGFEPLGKLFSTDSGALVTLATANNVYGMLALRLRDTHLDLATIIESFSTFSDSAGDYYCHVILNPTLSAGAWAFANVDATYSGMQVADGGNSVVINGGIYMYSAIISGRDSSKLDVKNERNLGAAIDGTRDIIALAIQPLTNNQDCGATINWREI